MRECQCSTRHVPAPVELVYEYGHWVCPTAAVNLHFLLEEWDRHGGEPPGAVTKHYGQFVRGLAREVKGVVG